VDCGSDSAQHRERKIALTPLYSAYITAIDIALVCEILLTKPQRHTRRSNPAAKLLQFG
jgi:hypothetical protein